MLKLFLMSPFKGFKLFNSCIACFGETQLAAGCNGALKFCPSSEHYVDDDGHQRNDAVQSPIILIGSLRLTCSVNPYFSLLLVKPV